MASLSMELALVAVNRMINTLEAAECNVLNLFRWAAGCLEDREFSFRNVDDVNKQIRRIVDQLQDLGFQLQPTRSVLGSALWLTIDDYRSRFQQVATRPIEVTKLCVEFLDERRRVMGPLNDLHACYLEGREPKPYLIEVMDALYTQHPIHALRIWRFATSCNLKEAIAAVCQLAVDNPDGIPESTMTWCRSKLELKEMTEVKTIEHADVTFMN